MSTPKYDEAFYKELASTTSRSANTIVPIVQKLVQPTSVVDVGCGVGTWLSVFHEHGIEDILGLDGDWVNTDLLQIPVEQFYRIDLEAPESLGRRFDLVVCLEVAEHLHPEASERFVKFLTDLGPVILFSAAIPYQGGVNHYNEQWPGYWALLFANHGYEVVDCIRPSVWECQDVLWWYKQNTFIYCHHSHFQLYPQIEEAWHRTKELPLAVVHPQKYLALHLSYKKALAGQKRTFLYRTRTFFPRKVKHLWANYLSFKARG